MSQVSNRLLSIKALQKILAQRGSLSSILRDSGKLDDSLNPALIQEYCFGVCRHFHRLNYMLTTLLEKPLRNKDSDIFCLLLIGLYQLLYMRTPDHATINETVAETTRLRKSWAKGLVNAILREALRQQAQLQETIDRDYSLKYSHPDWLISTFKRDWSKHYQAILSANNERAPMTLRLNLSQASREDYIERLSQQAISASAGKLCSTSIILDKPLAVTTLPGFNEGLVSVQDEASQVTAELLHLKLGHRVLDTCAAPGGKTCAILEAEPKLNELVAIDNDKKRLARIQENLNRTHLTATLVCEDICNIAAWWDGAPFDRILLDVPCSGTGVIRRHPDIKLLRKPGDITNLVKVQAAILKAVWPLLKPGGIMLYSTCSVLLDENSRQIASFINNTKDAQVLPIQSHLGQECRYGRQLFPKAGNHDGFYYALLQKC